MRHPHLAALLALTASVCAQTSPNESPRDYTFRDAPLNARGTQSLADLRGKPTLIEFWGVR